MLLHNVKKILYGRQHRIQDGRGGGGGARNMKYKAPRMAAIFLLLVLTGAGGHVMHKSR